MGVFTGSAESCRSQSEFRRLSHGTDSATLGKSFEFFDQLPSYQGYCIEDISRGPFLFSYIWGI
jgi:hypothetical protein